MTAICECGALRLLELKVSGAPRDEVSMTARCPFCGSTATMLGRDQAPAQIIEFPAKPSPTPDPSQGAGLGPSPA